MNAYIFLTTRINSTRLKNKALLNINGETVTDILINRLKKTGIPIIMCATTEQDDRRYLRPIADNHGIGYHEAPAGNIIAQHLQACKEFGVDYVILAECDDWLVCRETVNAVYYRANELKFKKAIRTEGLPFGLNVIAYPRENLENADFTGDTNWGVHVTKGAYILEFDYARPYKLSMDYLADFEIMKDVYLNCKRNQFVGGIVGYLDKHPEIASSNLRLNKSYCDRLKELKK
jgi:spore coat polysaccharide biosynthesis protein SpsF (cytidylyltransferase family)